MCNPMNINENIHSSLKERKKVGPHVRKIQRTRQSEAMRIPNGVFGGVLLKLPQEVLIPTLVGRRCRAMAVTESEVHL